MSSVKLRGDSRALVSSSLFCRLPKGGLLLVMADEKRLVTLTAVGVTTTHGLTNKSCSSSSGTCTDTGAVFVTRASQEPKSTRAFRAYTAEDDMAESGKAAAFGDDDDNNNEFDVATSSCLLAFGGCW